MKKIIKVKKKEMEVGEMKKKIWGLEESEKMMVFYEREWGESMKEEYLSKGGVKKEMKEKLIEDIGKWIDKLLKKLKNIDDIIKKKRILKKSKVDIGVVKMEEEWEWGL